MAERKQTDEETEVLIQQMDHVQEDLPLGGMHPNGDVTCWCLTFTAYSPTEPVLSVGAKGSDPDNIRAIDTAIESLQRLRETRLSRKHVYAGRTPQVFPQS